MLNFKHLKNDLPAGIVVFLVALPLCLGIALASGAPFFSGLISGVVGGIVVGFLSNSQVSVSGPAAGLVAIVLTSVATLGSYEAFLLAVLVAGLMQILMGAFKIGSVAEYFPSSVIRGMLTAIGIIIIVKQIPHAIGYTEGSRAATDDLSDHSLVNAFLSIFQIHYGATVICLISLAIIILFETSAVKKYTKNIPGSLIAVIVATFISEFIFSGNKFFEIADQHKVAVPVASSTSNFMKLFIFPDFSQLMNPNIYVVAITLSLVASIETLLCIEAADKLDKQRRITNTNRELIAQGAGNICSGIVGGLPITSVIVRTSANVHADAKTKLSTIIHGILLLVSAIFIPTMLNKIPLSCLAAILLVVGYKLSKPSIFIELYGKGKTIFMPFIVTVIMVFATDLLKGVACGFAVSLFLVLRENLKNSYFFHKENYHDGDKIRIRLAEEVSFLNKASIRRTLDNIPHNSNLVIDASHTYYIDSDVIDVIKEFIEIKATQRNIKCSTVGFKDKYSIDNSHFVEFEHSATKDA